MHGASLRAMMLDMGNPFSKTDYPNCFRGHKYAEDIVAGKILASKYVIGACKRYLKDITDEYHPKFFFDADKAERYLNRVQKFEHPIGRWKTKNIEYEPWQCFIWMNIMGFINRTTGYRRFGTAHIEVARGNGKALCPDTDVPTPDRGLVKFGSIQVGDKLYGSDGRICRVVGKNQLHLTDSYRIHFSDGTSVDCSGNHLWDTSSKKERETKRASVKTTEEIYKSVKVGKESNHSISLAKPVVGTRNDCQLGYVLGYWLGDGDSRSGRFTAHEDQFKEIKSRFKSRKLSVVVENRKGKSVRFRVPALTYWLNEMGLIGNKHIPEKYFQAPEEVRRELLRGLMDSDGHCSKDIGNFIFYNSNFILAKQTRRLIASLGYKSRLRKYVSKCQNGLKGISYSVTFSSPSTRPSIFGIRAKEDRRSNRPSQYCDKRYITRVDRIKRKKMFCIQVDSRDSNFLITDQYIPTHNSPMASQAGLYFGFLDDPHGNQVSTVATKKEQARIVLDAARFMARKNEKFLQKKQVQVRAHTIIQESTNSVMRAMSSEASTLDGLNDVLAIADELHAMDRDTFEVISSGMAKRSDSLLLCITTAGFDIDSAGYAQSEYAKKICMGEHEDDTFFAIVYTLDEEDVKDIYNEKNWIKANPNLGVSVDIQKFRAKLEKAKITPADVNNVMVKNLNVWTNADQVFFNLEHWDKCADPSLKIEDFVKTPARVAIDLASKIDLTSKAIMFRKNGIYYLFVDNFIPEERAKEVKSTIYDEAIASGDLIATPGAAINNDLIRERLEQDAKKFRVLEGFYDPWNATEMAQKLSNKIEMVEFRQNTANLSEPTKTLDALMREGKLRHNGNKILRWAIGNVVVKVDSNDNVFPRKTHQKFKIDPAIASIMVLAGWLQDEKKDSVYESRGLRVLGGR